MTNNEVPIDLPPQNNPTQVGTIMDKVESSIYDKKLSSLHQSFNKIKADYLKEKSKLN